MQLSSFHARRSLNKELQNHLECRVSIVATSNKLVKLAVLLVPVDLDAP